MSTWLETERLVIRTFEPGDCDPWIAMVSDPDVVRFLPPSPAPTAERFQRALEDRLAMEDEYGYAIWAVADAATGTFVGQCGLRPIDESAGPETEIAYHYNKASWNKGYGTEAAVAVLDHGLGDLGIDRVVAVAMAENVGSWRVMEKAGMIYVGLVSYFGVDDLKKYVADRDRWSLITPRR
jgi:[ribosomal protein S5]-alanine N-acetyltransferase